MTTKRWLIILTISVVLAGCGPKPLATVNGKPIAKADIERRLKVLEKESPDLFTGGEGKETKEEITQQILDSIIEERLLLAEAEKLGINADNAISQFEQLKESMSEEDWEENLKQLGTTEAQLREDIRTQEVLEKVRAAKIKQLIRQVKISDKEVTKYYKSNRKLYLQPPQTRMEAVMLRSKTDVTLFTREHKNGKSFAELAKQLGVDSLGAEVGEPVNVLQGEAGPEMERVASALPLNVLSAPIIINDEVWLIKVLSRKQARQAELSEVKKEVSDAIKDAKGEELFIKWLSKLKKRSDIEK